MSEKLISLNPDLQKLRDDGYEVEVRSGFLILHSIPYVNSRKEVVFGKVVTDLTLNGDKTVRPADHQVWFSGDFPCNADGTVISPIQHSSMTSSLCEGVVVHHRFSCKPVGGYPDYYEKMTRYVEIISSQARAIDSSVDPRTYKPIPESEDRSVFCYTDSASSRAGITSLANKLAMDRVAIVGLGGTGSYVLDLVAKTHVKEIHLFDGDDFLQHNAFRAPGAASIESLGQKPSKVEYFADIYGKMRRGIVAHHGYLDDETVNQLNGFSFVFLCVDKSSVRQLLSNYLNDRGIPFVDVGMELELISEQQCLIGTCRTTLCAADKNDHFSRHVSVSDGNVDDLYSRNIQVADLNALNASLAVVKWKKFCGFYQDCYEEYQSAYVVNAHQLTRDETNEADAA